jgi:GAF domain-containing protein
MLGALGGLVGVLQVLNKSDGPFIKADEELLLALAAQAAIAIENARLYHSLVSQNQELVRARRHLERRTRELNALYEVEKELSAALDLDDLLSRILAQAITVLWRRRRSIALVEPDGSCGSGPCRAAAPVDRAHAAARHGLARVVDRASHAARHRQAPRGSAPRARDRARDRRDPGAPAGGAARRR